MLDVVGSIALNIEVEVAMIPMMIEQHNVARVLC